MKAEELMLGDLVYCNYPSIKKNVRIDQIKRGGDDELKMVIINEVPLVFAPRYIEPIPLTPEILEKNFQEFLPGINLMYQLKGPYCAMNEDGQWVFGLVKVDGEDSARYPLVKISFVHQLQHALRLCGIEKEITI